VVKALQEKLESIFSKHIPKTYITATVLLDIFLLTYTFFTLDLAKL